MLGRAMRLGAMLSGSATGALDHASLGRKGERLVLTLRGEGRAFAGEVVERRLQSLADRVGCRAEIVLEDRARPDERPDE